MCIFHFFLRLYSLKLWSLVFLLALYLTTHPMEKFDSLSNRMSLICVHRSKNQIELTVVICRAFFYCLRNFNGLPHANYRSIVCSCVRLIKLAKRCINPFYGSQLDISQQERNTSLTDRLGSDRCTYFKPSRVGV